MRKQRPNYGERIERRFRLFLLLCALLAALLALCARAGEAVEESKPRRFVATVTAYCHCAKCCGVAGQPTANGVMPVEGVTVAGPRSVPFGTRVKIEGWKATYVVQDRLAKRYDDRWDIFMRDHERAKQWGIKQRTITILEKANE